MKSRTYSHPNRGPISKQYLQKKNLLPSSFLVVLLNLFVIQLHPYHRQERRGEERRLSTRKTSVRNKIRNSEATVVLLRSKFKIKKKSLSLYSLMGNDVQISRLIQRNQILGIKKEILEVAGETHPIWNITDMYQDFLHHH